MFTYLNPRRGDLFATSFTRQVIDIERGNLDVLKHGNLDSVRTIVDIRDAMSSYWYALTKGVQGEVYNIGGEHTLTVGEFLNMLKAEATCEIKSEQCPSLLRPVDVTLQIPDSTKFKKDTGWEPEHSLEDSISFFIQNCRENYG
jgi:GDPmannose 4,6-dehydratase/GDP-4-dehydro-6-deoxy-D-mannose reductase